MSGIRREYFAQALRAALRSIFVVVASAMLLFSSDTLHLSPVAELAKAHLYSLVQWELENFTDKWLYQLRLLLPGDSLEDTEKVDLVLEYFSLGAQERELVRETERFFASSPGRDNDSLSALEDDLARVRKARIGMRDRVEEILESEIDAVISNEGLALGGPLKSLGLRFPPVDFRFDPSPRVLVVSPRDRIERAEDVLLKPDITLEEMESLEQRVLEQEDLSALVEGTGGVASYPSVVAHDTSLKHALNTAAHEWLHHYLFFRPLGQGYWRSSDLTSLNETLASIFGREVSEIAYSRYQVAEDVPDPPQSEVQPLDQDAFDFAAEMRETRLRTDELLGEGNIEEAEEYMEQRRQLFVAHGYYIRKLNQAYFAFHGTYADSPASVSTRIRAARGVSTERRREHRRDSQSVRGPSEPGPYMEEGSSGGCYEHLWG